MLIFSVYMQNNAISFQLEPELKNVQAELEKCQMHLIQNRAPFLNQIRLEIEIFCEGAQ